MILEIGQLCNCVLVIVVNTKEIKEHVEIKELGIGDLGLGNWWSYRNQAWLVEFGDHYIIHQLPNFRRPQLPNSRFHLFAFHQSASRDVVASSSSPLSAAEASV